MSEQPTILLVEDSDNDRLIALRAFQTLETVEEVEVACDGQQALEMLNLEGEPVRPPLRPRVIFLDLKMPRIDGWEVLKEIRSAEHTRDIPVVIVSASDREEDVRECYRLGANSFLVKRFDASRPGAYLAEAARYWIELNRPPQSPRRDSR